MLRSEETAREVRYERNALRVYYDDDTVITLRAVRRRRSANLYGLRTLHLAGLDEVFNFEGCDDVSFRNCTHCDSMSLLEMRPWIANVKRCTSKNRCGVYGHDPTNARECSEC